MTTSITTLDQQSVNPFADSVHFEHAQRVAKAMTNSSLVPEAYRGADKVANVLIALEVAKRVGASPLAVMQSLHIVQGRPSWSASFLIATVNACGRFTPLRFESEGTDPDADDYRVRAVAKDKDNGFVCEGPWITWRMVKAEGWLTKNGSKWKSMPALMFMYRAAAFWTRVYAPELSLGIQTAEEVQDVFGGNTTTVTVVEPRDITDLQARLQARAQLAHDPEPKPTVNVDPETGEVIVEARDVLSALNKADTVDELDHAAADIDLLPGNEKRGVREVYVRLRADLLAREETN